MTVPFDEFVFNNTSGLHVTATLEAPAGTIVGTYEVDPGSVQTIKPWVRDVQSARVIVVVANLPDHDATQELSTSGRSNHPFISVLRANFHPGSIWGELTAKYPRVS